jgi:hypothetical protein
MTEQQIIEIAVVVLVVAPVLLLVFLGLVALIVGLIRQVLRDRHRAGTSVAALINEVKGYGPSQPDPLEHRARQLMKAGQQQVEDEVMANLDRIVTIFKEKETNHK